MLEHLFSPGDSSLPKRQIVVHAIVFCAVTRGQALGRNKIEVMMRETNEVLIDLPPGVFSFITTPPFPYVLTNYMQVHEGRVHSSHFVHPWQGYCTSRYRRSLSLRHLRSDAGEAGWAWKQKHYCTRENLYATHASTPWSTSWPVRKILMSGWLYSFIPYSASDSYFQGCAV